MFSLLKSSVCKTCVINGICNNKLNLMTIRESGNELRKRMGRGYAPTSKRKLTVIMLPATRSNARNLLIHKATKVSQFERRKYNREMTILKETVESNIRNKLLLDVKKENRKMEEEKFIASRPVEYRDFLKCLFDTMNQCIDFKEPSLYEMIKMIIDERKTKDKDDDTELVTDYFYVRILFHLYFNNHSFFYYLKWCYRDIREEEMSCEYFAYILTSRRFVGNKSLNDGLMMSSHISTLKNIWSLLQYRYINKFGTKP